MSVINGFYNTALPNQAEVSLSEEILIFCATYPSVMSEKDGITLYVSVDDALCVEDRQCL